MASITILAFKLAQLPNGGQATTFFCYSKDAFNGLSFLTPQQLQAYIQNGDTVTNIQNNDLNNINSKGSIPLYNIYGRWVDKDKGTPIMDKTASIFLLGKRITNRGTFYDYVQMPQAIQLAKALSVPEISFMQYQKIDNVQKINYKYVTKDDKTFVQLKEGELNVIDETQKAVNKPKPTLQPQPITSTPVQPKPVAPTQQVTAPAPTVQVTAPPTQPVTASPVQHQHKTKEMFENRGRTFTREELAQIHGADIKNFTPYEKRQWWNYRAELKIMTAIARTFAESIISVHQLEDLEVPNPTIRELPSRDLTQYYKITGKLIKEIVTPEEYETLKPAIVANAAKPGLLTLGGNTGHASHYSNDDWWFVIQYFLRDENFKQILEQQVEKRITYTQSKPSYRVIKGLQQGKLSELLYNDERTIPEMKKFIEDYSIQSTKMGLPLSQQSIKHEKINTLYTIEPIKNSINDKPKYNFAHLDEQKHEKYVEIFQVGYNFDDIEDYYKVRTTMQEHGYLLFVKWAYILAEQLTRGYSETLFKTKVEDFNTVASLLYAKVPAMYKLARTKLADKIAIADKIIKGYDSGAVTPFSPLKSKVDEFKKHDIKVDMVDIEKSYIYNAYEYYEDIIDKNISVFAVDYSMMGITLNDDIFGDPSNSNY